MTNLDAITVQPTPTQPTITQGLWQVERVTAAGRRVVIVRGSDCPDPQPEDWRDRLAWFINQIPGVAIVGPKRLTPDGHVFSLGEFIIHPKGFHHHGKGTGQACYRFPEEVDAIAGGVMVVDEQAFDHVDGEGVLSSMGQLGMIALSLSIRDQGCTDVGGRVLAVPQVVVNDTFTPRLNEAESAQFAGEFGFDWVAPDLDVVREKYAGRGLLWNAFFHAGMMPFEKYDERGALCWEGYQKADVFRQRAHHLAKLVAQHTLPPTGLGGHVLDVGSGDGLFSHLFAVEGCEVVGIDPEPAGVEQAAKMCAGQTYPEGSPGAPQFRVGAGDAIPFEDQTAACVSLFDVIEHLNNPIGVLREISRVLRPGGHFICVTPSWQFGGSSDPTYHGFEFNVEELNRLINAAPGLTVVNNGNIGGVYRDIIAIARKDT
ncbi:MAG: class I SAM-dependent methyltransferase [Planctomycetota bacterium]